MVAQPVKKTLFYAIYTTFGTLLNHQNQHMTSWVKINEGSDFTIHNIPFGICELNEEKFAVSRIGNTVINLNKMHLKGFF